MAQYDYAWKPHWEYVVTFRLRDGSTFRWGGEAMNDFHAVSQAMSDAWRRELDPNVLPVRAMASVLSYDDDGTERRVCLSFRQAARWSLDQREWNTFKSDDSDDEWLPQDDI